MVGIDTWTSQISDTLFPSTAPFAESADVHDQHHHIESILPDKVVSGSKKRKETTPCSDEKVSRQHSELTPNTRSKKKRHEAL